jgi:hypothetical protein
VTAQMCKEVMGHPGITPRDVMEMIRTIGPARVCLSTDYGWSTQVPVDGGCHRRRATHHGERQPGRAAEPVVLTDNPRVSILSAVSGRAQQYSAASISVGVYPRLDLYERAAPYIHNMRSERGQLSQLEPWHQQIQHSTASSTKPSARLTRPDPHPTPPCASQPHMADREPTGRLAKVILRPGWPPELAALGSQDQMTPGLWFRRDGRVNHPGSRVGLASRFVEAGAPLEVVPGPATAGL